MKAVKNKREALCTPHEYQFRLLILQFILFITAIGLPEIKPGIDVQANQDY
jgi:hypothetical protein